MRTLLCLLVAALPLVASEGDQRSYDREVSPPEKKQITFMVTTLADKPMAKLFFFKGALEKAGNSVDHVHPLRFFQTVYTDQPLIASMGNMRKRGWVFDEFMEGMGKSFDLEKQRGNLTDEQMEEFAKAIEVDPKLIAPAFKQGRWNEFITIVTENVPRKGDHGRYDM